jgi:protein-disulfide isomerase
MNNKKQQQMIIMGSVVVVALIAAGALILLSGQTTSSSVDYSALQPTRLEDGGFVIGDPNAPITLIEFADFACPHCQTYKETADRFITDFVMTGKARFEYRVFPTAGGPLTEFAGQLAQCADELEPGAFWQAHELFYQYARTARYGQEMGRQLATDLGLDYSELLECSRTADQVQADVELGRRIGVSGTPAVAVRYGDAEPTFINLNGQSYDRGAAPYEILAEVVEQAQ